MNFCGYEPVDMINGEGVRCSLWVSGCSHGCRGCFNQKVWSYTSGNKFTEQDLERLLSDLGRPFIKGLSVLGGEPLDPQNVEKVADILDRVRFVYGDKKDIMLWTGYKFSEVSDRIKNLVDIVMDGKYDDSHPTTKRFRGSDNQVMWVKQNGKWKEENMNEQENPA